MTQSTNATRAQRNPPGIVGAILFGALLGIISALVEIVCVVAIINAQAIVPLPSPFESWIAPFLLYTVTYVLIWVYYAVGPATLGGAVLGLIFQRMARSGQSDKRINIALGALVGFIDGLVTAGLIAATQQSGEWMFNLPRDPLTNGATGVIGGLFVSWILYGWLKRRMK